MKLKFKKKVFLFIITVNCTITNHFLQDYTVFEQNFLIEYGRLIELKGLPYNSLTGNKYLYLIYICKIFIFDVDDH